MTDIPKRIESLFEETGHTIADTTWTVLLSGGLDSTVLLHAFSCLQKESDLSLQALHINHELRGNASRDDEAFCQQLCHRWDVPLITYSVDVRALSHRERLGIEEAGRMARHQAMSACLTQQPGTCFVLAHHKDDQLETVLMNIQRGAHMPGLAGLKTYRNLRSPKGVLLPLFRPLLSLPKRELEVYARSHGLSWREDRSNRDTRFERNRIRHEVIPLLEKVLPGFTTNILALSATCGRQEATLLNEAETILARHARHQAGGWLLQWSERGPESRNLFLAAMRLLLEREWCAVNLCSPHYRSLWHLCTRSQSGAVLQLPGGLRVRKECDGLWIYHAGTDSTKTAEVLQLPPPPFRFASAEGLLRAEMRPPPLHLPKEDAEDASVQWFDADALCAPLTWGPLREGERIRPLGAPGSKPVRQLLIDKKVPLRERQQIRVLRDHAGAVWIHPVCIANRLRLTPETRQALRIELQLQK